VQSCKPIIDEVVKDLAAVAKFLKWSINAPPLSANLWWLVIGDTEQARALLEKLNSQYYQPHRVVVT
jgi:hypothetical protein